jgi:hypothetical protein
MTLSRRRKIAFALLTMTIVGGAALLMFVAADVYLHWRTQDVAGWNIWGYRGAPVARKQAGEIRVVMLGGSTVFGWGLPAHESIPAFLERRLNAASGQRRFSVVNLGAPGQGAYGFVFDLEDFEALDYDIVCLYEGYNDLAAITPRGQSNYLQWRRQSPIFRWTGYQPILPIVLREKATALLQGGTVNAADVRFEPGLATRAGAGAMNAAAAIAERVTGVTGSFSSVPPPPPSPPTDGECIDTWQRYCGSVRDAVAWALERNKRVIVATQPFVSDLHIEQQANVAGMLRARFGGDPRVQYVDLGRVVDMRDRTIAYDGLHLIASGNDRIAGHLLQPVLAAAGIQ